MDEIVFETQAPTGFQKTATDMHAAIRDLENHLKDAIDQNEIQTVRECMVRISAWRAAMESLIQ